MHLHTVRYVYKNPGISPFGHKSFVLIASIQKKTFVAISIHTVLVASEKWQNRAQLNICRLVAQQMQMHTT
jgi:hypothetical protein